MGRCALLDGNANVVNVVEAGDDYTAPDGLIAHPLADDEPVGPGYRKQGSAWVAPEPSSAPSAPTLDDVRAVIEAAADLPDAVRDALLAVLAAVESA